MEAPQHLLPLPAPPPSRSWPANVRNTYSIVTSAYDQAIAIRELRSSEPLRISVAKDRLIDIRPLLVGMEYDGISPDWTQQCAASLMAIDRDLAQLFLQASEE